ncbi:MAG TPA: hypothetical protein VK210_06470 [Terriglobia bacterium]|nr:hypothetical protein [Terriglobia bacterium]
MSNGKIVLWCYVIWYLVTVVNYFDPSPSIWLNSLGISAVIGVALLLSVGTKSVRAAFAWQTFRLFAMPFCVSSFSALIKGRGYFLVVPPKLDQQVISVSLCAAFVAIVSVMRHFNAGSRG